MDLGYLTITPLDASKMAFFADGTTAVRTLGQRLIGDWEVSILSSRIHTTAEQPMLSGQPAVQTVGRFSTVHPESPIYPVDADGNDISDYRTVGNRAIVTWLLEQAPLANLRLVGWRSDPAPVLDDPRPFFCGGVAVLANSDFLPAPEVAYADQRPVDEVVRTGGIAARYIRATVGHFQR